MPDYKAANQDLALSQRALGSLYEHGNGVKQDYAEALKWYRKAAFNNPVFSRQLAWVLATCPDARFRDAVSAENIFKKGIPTTKNPFALDVLAAIYAANGKFTDAINTEKDAISNYQIKNSATIRKYEARLALYEANTPYIDTPNSP